MSALIGIALVVEDEPLIAMLACELLHDMGHIVFEARTFKEAMTLLATVEGISLVFTDVDLADGSSGADLAVLVKRAFPTVRIVVTSGRLKPATLPDSVPFIPKPYTRACLMRALDIQIALSTFASLATSRLS
ncbi:response regulator (plasmid) [Rhizobium indicum]|uniref:response regulator n=1 Tax=Rhizobium indicum TaxID=2583231 RepID=UPI001106BEE1|nr:response regulator [Rhizobium indicum]QKK33383.1 response regulator [Rhizobium indicum]